MRRRTLKRQFQLQRARVRVERLERRDLLAADIPCVQNPFDPADVNDDGQIAPMDVLMVINVLNAAEGEGAPNGGRRGFTDVNGDGQNSPQDVLPVINRLNRRDTPGGDQPGGPVNLQLPPSSLDGSGNNSAHPEWGSAGVDLLRIAPAAYEDGIASPAGSSRPSTRQVSNVLSDETEVTLNDRHLTALTYAWGQFLDHDMDLTTPASPAEPFNIQVPTGDPHFDPLGTGDAEIVLNRSVFNADTGTTDPRQQINTITAFIDGSQIYGSNDEQGAALRTFTGGLLRSSEGNLLPLNDSGMFLAGDIRVNENANLMTMQTLFVREHNRLAAEIGSRDSALSDEQVFQRARSIVIGELQSITYNEFLPALMGLDALRPYTGYKPDVNPGIANEFSTAAFRVGHTMLGEEIEFLDVNGEEIREALPLREAFFNADPLHEVGIDPVLNYLVTDEAREIDTQVVDDVRNFLFGPPGSGGFDLVSLNLQRGRDHGLSDYNTTREAYGLPRVASFAEITSNVELQEKLAELYGDVDNIDLWAGGLAEDHVPGASVGPTFRRILVDQFERLRDGDRYWYQNALNRDQQRLVEQSTLAAVIRRNTEATKIQDNPFFMPEVMTWEANRGGADLAVVRRDDQVNLINRRARDPLQQQPADDVAQIVLAGADNVPDRVLLDLTNGSLPQVESDGGAGPRDTLVLRLPAATQSVLVTPRVIEIDGQAVAYSRYEAIMIETASSNTEVTVGPRVEANVILNGRPVRRDSKPPRQPAQPADQPIDPQIGRDRSTNQLASAVDEIFGEVGRRR